MSLQRDFKDPRRRYLMQREAKAVRLLNKVLGTSASRAEGVNHKLLIDAGIVLDDTEVLDPSPGAVAKFLSCDLPPVRAEPWCRIFQPHATWLVLQDPRSGHSHYGFWFVAALTDPDYVLKTIKTHNADRGMILIKPTRDGRWLTMLQLSLFRKLGEMDGEDPDDYYQE
jgi:hypothetical protein